MRYNSIQRLHKYNCCRRTNILRHPLRTPPISSSIHGLPPFIETIQTNKFGWVHCQHSNDCVGSCVDCLFLLSNCAASYRWKYEYADLPLYILSPFMLYKGEVMLIVF